MPLYAIVEQCYPGVVVSGVLFALLAGLAATSPPILGTVVGIYVLLPNRFLAVMIAFSGGALIAAIAFDMFLQSYRLAGMWGSGIGMLMGAVAYGVVKTMLHRASQRREHLYEGWPIFLSAMLEGTPKCILLGSTLYIMGEAPVALLVAIFASNFAEGFAISVLSADQRRQSGWTRISVTGFWTTAAFLQTLIVVCVYGSLALSQAGLESSAILPALAGGAVLSSLSGAQFEYATRRNKSHLIGIATVGGFLLSFLLSRG